MADTIFFITDHSVQVDVLHTAEDILLNVRILLAKLCGIRHAARAAAVMISPAGEVVNGLRRAFFKPFPQGKGGAAFLPHPPRIRAGFFLALLGKKFTFC